MAQALMPTAHATFSIAAQWLEWHLQCSICRKDRSWRTENPLAKPNSGIRNHGIEIDLCRYLH